MNEWECEAVYGVPLSGIARDLELYPGRQEYGQEKKANTISPIIA